MNLIKCWKLSFIMSPSENGKWQKHTHKKTQIIPAIITLMSNIYLSSDQLQHLAIITDRSKGEHRERDQS